MEIDYRPILSIGAVIRVVAPSQRGWSWYMLWPEHGVVDTAMTWPDGALLLVSSDVGRWSVDYYKRMMVFEDLKEPLPCDTL